MSMSEPPKFSLFQRPFSKKKAPEPATSGDSGSDNVPLQASDETKKKVQAAKSYIENMYRVQHDKIQERYAR